MPQQTIRSVRDQITDVIRSDIFSRRLPSGSRLSEVDLAKRFGVSRGPIREALSQLTHEGLLISKPNCGVSVAPASTVEIRDLIVPLRRTIETFALRTSFETLDDRDFRVWGEILLKMEFACRNDDEEEIVLQDIAFHRAIVTRAEQPDLLTIWQTILGRVRGHFHEEVHRRRDILHEIAEDHQRLLAVFQQGDVSAAVEALDQHIW